MTKRLEKPALLEALRADLTRALDVMLAAAKTARDAATHEESKPENDKDTRGLEAGYLAGAQAARAAEIRTALLELAATTPRSFAPDERVATFALVEARDLADNTTLCVFISPHGGGLKVAVDGAEVQVVTPRSPLGDALVGKRRGDIVEVAAGRRLRELEVVAVS